MLKNEYFANNKHDNFNNYEGLGTILPMKNQV